MVVFCHNYAHPNKDLFFTLKVKYFNLKFLALLEFNKNIKPEKFVIIGTAL
jgi:hypothetical protein